MSGRVHINVGVYSPDLGYIPEAMTAGAAGFDLRARIAGSITIYPGEAYTIPVGIRLAIPRGYVGLVCPRSGLSAVGIRAGNSPGVIDSDYRGEVMAILTNTSTQEFVIAPGSRIAQIVFVEIPHVSFDIAMTPEALQETARGESGFGSTGLS